MAGAPVSSSFAVPPPDVIRRAAEEIIGRPDYNIEAVPQDYTSSIERLIRAIGRLLRPFQEAFQALHEASPFLAWLLFAVLLLIAVALVVHIAYTFRAALRGRRTSALGEEPEDPAATRPGLWEARAREAVAAADYLNAIRYLFRASLLRLEAARRGAFKRGATNREYLRRFGGSPAFEPLGLFVEAIDTKWYAGGSSTREDYESCVSAHSSILQVARETSHAHSA